MSLLHGTSSPLGTLSRQVLHPINT